MTQWPLASNCHIGRGMEHFSATNSAFRPFPAVPVNVPVVFPLVVLVGAGFVARWYRPLGVFVWFDNTPRRWVVSDRVAVVVAVAVVVVVEDGEGGFRHVGMRYGTGLQFWWKWTKKS